MSAIASNSTGGVAVAQLQALQAGDDAAFRELVRDHHRALTAVANSIVGQSDAEEVVQIAWIKAHQNMGRFEGRASLRTWLTRIVINESKMWLRKYKRERSLQVDIDSPQPLADRFSSGGHWSKPPAAWHNDTPDDLLMVSELADCLDHLLGDMPDQQRSLLEMRDAGGMPFDEICNELTISASNARVLLHRARSQLFKLVDHYQETGEC
ncbi:MAG: RNA polymerase subunit sigma-70 [Spongiibacteraceae bacterium]|nr:RNA polymerase subunit sigma-70 [Spongiibacteraceae bacterium]|tara:strand:- start:1230 stop:1859 length:630 start_codon:yes stop_codon:yes gene_type:complete